MKADQIIYVDPREVSFLIHRDRDPEGFALMKDSIREMGIRQPIQVRESKSKGKKWQAFFGEGRCTAAVELYEETGDRRFLRVPATIETEAEAEIAGRFLSENLIRRSLSWQEQARLIKQDVEAEAGSLTPDRLFALSQRYFITVAHLEKLLRILQKLSPSLEKELKEMTIREAELLTSLPSAGQEIVIETLKEEGLQKSASNIASVVRRAREQHQETGEWSKSALKASLKRVGEDLDRVRKSLKPIRLHHSLGPENLRTLLQDRKFRNQLTKHKINVSKFEEAMK